MIIDFLRTCANIIKISDYNSASSNLISNKYTVKTTNDIKSWSLSNNAVSSVSFTIISLDVKKLKEIVLDVVGSQNLGDVSIKIETSLDHINWYELVYKQDLISPTKYLYKKYDINSDNYYNVTLNTIETVQLSDYINFTYAYKTENIYNKEITYLYDNLEWKFIKITFDNIPETYIEGLDVSLFFTNLENFIEEDFKDELIDTNLLEMKSSMFTQSKIFEEYEFMPDMFKNYLKMIEEKNSKINTLAYTNLCVNTDPISSSTHLEGIGHDIIDVDTVVYP